MMSAKEIQRFREGDGAIFAELLREHGGLVRAAVISFSTDDDDLQDLCQEIWLRVYNKRRLFSGGGSFTGWLLSVARRVCLSRQETEGVRTRAKQRHEEQAGVVGWVSPAPNPLDEAVAADTRTRLLSAFSGLPERQGTAIILRLYQDCSPKETADLMGCKKATVRSLIRNGMVTLRTLMEKNGDGILPRD